MSFYPDDMTPEEREQFDKEYEQYLIETGQMAPDGGYTEEQMAQMSEDHHVETILNSKSDYDPINDKEGFENLIYCVDNHYISLDSGDYNKYNDSDTRATVDSKLTDMLVHHAEAYDHYDFVDAYDSMEDGFADIRKAVTDAEQLRQISDKLKEDFEKTFDEPSRYADRLNEYDDAVGKNKDKEKNTMKQERNGQFAFDFSKDVDPSKKQKSHADYEFEAAKYQQEHSRDISEEEARERIASGEFSEDVLPWMSDEERSDALLREQEEAEDRAWEEKWAADEKKAQQATDIKSSSVNNQKAPVDYSKLDGAPKPFKPRRLPNGATQYNGFPTDEKGNMYDDGFSFDEIDHDDDQFGD